MINCQPIHLKTGRTGVRRTGMIQPRAELAQQAVPAASSPQRYIHLRRHIRKRQSKDRRRYGSRLLDGSHDGISASGSLLSCLISKKEGISTGF